MARYSVIADRVPRHLDFAARKLEIEALLEAEPPILVTDCPHSLAEEFMEALHQRGDALDLNRAKDEGRLNSVSTFYEWVCGNWLESYVLWALQQANAQGRFGMHNLYRNVEPSFQGSGPDLFEVDVVGIRGYQLFGISCAIETRVNENGGRAKVEAV